MDAKTPARSKLLLENAELRARLAEAEEMLRAIRSGAVDALVVDGPAGPRLFTLQGLDAESNRFRGEILAQVSDAVIALDNDSRVAFFNAAAERQYGLPASEVLGRHIADIYEQRWPSGDEAEATAALAERGAWRGESIHVLRDGREMPVESSVTVLRGHDGTATGLLAVIRDITERKQVEMELHSLNTTLEKRVAERTAEARQRASQLKAVAVKLIQAESRERQRLARILHDNLQQLLFAAKMWLGFVRPETVPAAARKDLLQVAQILKEAIETARSLSIDLSPPVLQSAGLIAALHWLARFMLEKHKFEVEIAADPAAELRDPDTNAFLFNAAKELLFNIVKHAGVPKAKVCLSRTAGGMAELSVEDSGKGFDPSRAHSAPETAAGRQRSDGSGLTSICERIDLLGGHMTLNAAPGQGTRIGLLLPLPQVDADLPADPAGSAAAAGAANRSPSASIRVLVVDDHKILRQGLVGLLSQQAGIKLVGEAADGEIALELSRRCRPDVVLMDVNIPKMNGIEATRRITAELPGVRVIGLSMHSDPEAQAKMRSAGAVDYRTKDGPAEALIAAIHRCVDANRPS